MRMSRQTLAVANLIGIVRFLGAQAGRCSYLPRLGRRPDLYSARNSRSAGAAVEACGSEKFDVVYHVDGPRYQLGGCDREYVGEWSKHDGIPIGHQHGRLGLDCQWTSGGPSPVGSLGAGQGFGKLKDSHHGVFDRLIAHAAVRPDGIHGVAVMPLGPSAPSAMLEVKIWPSSSPARDQAI